jgi:hypothetical protein
MFIATVKYCMAQLNSTYCELGQAIFSSLTQGPIFARYCRAATMMAVSSLTVIVLCSFWDSYMWRIEHQVMEMLREDPSLNGHLPQTMPLIEEGSSLLFHKQLIDLGLRWVPIAVLCGIFFVYLMSKRQAKSTTTSSAAQK